MKKELERYISEAGLVETNDPKIDRPVYRKPGFDGVRTPEQMDEKIVGALRDARVAKGLTRADLALLFGSAAAAYGRYESGATKLIATRIINLCEVLHILPDELFFDAAPHLWGDDLEDARKRQSITKLVQQVSSDGLDTVTVLLEAMVALKAKGSQS